MRTLSGRPLAGSVPSTRACDACSLALGAPGNGTCANVVGPGDSRSVSATYIRLVHQAALPFSSRGEASFCHVREVARALIGAAERGRTGERYLLGGAVVLETLFGFAGMGTYAVDAVTGQLVWKRKVDEHRLAAITGAIAGAMKAKRLLFLTDVPGVLDKNGTLIPEMTVEKARELIADGTISGGMIPKVENCIDAVNRGVEAAVIMDGRVPHCLLLEVFTESGLGTMVKRGTARP